MAFGSGLSDSLWGGQCSSQWVSYDCSYCTCHGKEKPWIGPHRENFLVHGQWSIQWATTVVTIAVPAFVAVNVTIADTDKHTTASRLLLLASKNPSLLCYSCIAAGVVVVVDCGESQQEVVQGFEPDECT
jgi:hypothetical protein